MVLSFGLPFSSKSWMAQLSVSATASLADITIPGTHDTGTWNGNSNDQCQTMDFQNQLDAGIRWFDLRLVMDGDEM